MQRWTLLALLATWLAFSVQVKAFAQDSDVPTQKPLSVQIGAIDRHFLLGNARDLFSTGVHFGASYAFPIKALQTSGATVAIDYDYNHNRGHKGYLASQGLSLVGRVLLTRNSKTDPVAYVGAGIGEWDASVKYTTTISKTTSMPSRTDPTKIITTTTVKNFESSGSGTKLGGKILVGVSFTSDSFIELSYIVTRPEAGVSPSCLNMAIGIRF